MCILQSASATPPCALLVHFSPLKTLSLVLSLFYRKTMHIARERAAAVTDAFHTAVADWDAQHVQYRMNPVEEGGDGNDINYDDVNDEDGSVDGSGSDSAAAAATADAAAGHGHDEL
jgi:hypothetical protein